MSREPEIRQHLSKPRILRGRSVRATHSGSLAQVRTESHLFGKTDIYVLRHGGVPSWNIANRVPMPVGDLTNAAYGGKGEHYGQ
jgi:hypothetical protein